MDSRAIWLDVYKRQQYERKNYLAGPVFVCKKEAWPIENDKRIAVLIDADNVSPKYIRYILDEIANYGIPTYKRIYGDCTKPQLSNWKEVLLEHSITPIQQYSYTTGKNATDCALIIDACLLYTSRCV